MPQVWSLFSGAMGLDLGLEAAGLVPTLAVEKDPWCCRTARLNRPSIRLVEGDVSRLTAQQLRDASGFTGEVDLLAGGPPCQAFSTAGKRAALSDPRGNLVYDFFRLVRDIRPRFFLMENVANLVTAALRHRKIADRPGQHWSLKQYAGRKTKPGETAPELAPDELSGSAIQQLLRDIEPLGYSITFGVLNAADFGAAQHRWRVVLLGSRDQEVPELPEPTHGEECSGLPPYRTLRDAIGDLEENPGEHSNYTPEVANFFSQVPAGGNWRNLPPELVPTAMGRSALAGGGKTGFYRRLSWDKPAPTITGRANRKGTALCHPSTIRPLSVRECARLQGFPDDWQFVGAMNRQYLQVGNAVPVALGTALGTTLLAAMTGTPTGNDRVPAPVSRLLATAVQRLRATARNKVGNRPQQPSLF